MLSLAWGHVFVLLMKGAFPVSILPAVKIRQEVCTVICATVNPLEVIVAETEQGRGVLGVVDGSSPRGLEEVAGKRQRIDFLPRIG